MIGYTDRATRCNGSRSRIECCSTPAPSSGYMFCSAPIHTPIIPVRKSPKYFQVSDSAPRGCDRRRESEAEPAEVLTLTLPPGNCPCPEDNVDNTRCLQAGSAVLRGGNRFAAAL